MEENLLHQVKNCNPIAHWRKETSSIRAEQQVPLAVDSAQEVRELVAMLARVARSSLGSWERTLKSVFMISVAL